jgi:long-chain fatty acid transport protein
MKLFDGCVAAAALMATATTAIAQDSLNRPGSGARAAGMGNAFIAVADDGTAASWNPAGLSQLRAPELSVVHSVAWRDLFLEGYRTRDRATLFTSLKTPNTGADLEFVSAAVPFTIAGRPVTVQVGWRRLYQISGRIQGDTRRVPVSPQGRPESLIRFDNSAQGSVDLWSVAGAARVTSRLSVGWSTDFYRGEWENRSNVSEDPGVLGSTDFIAARETNAIGDRTLNLGMLLAYPSVRVGVVYHGPLRSVLEVTNSTRSSLTEPFNESIGRDDGAELRFPHSIGLGVAWLPRPLVRLALDATYDEWTQFLVRATLPGFPDIVRSGFDQLPPELSATRNTVTVNAGLEKLFPVRGRYVPLRMGFIHEPQGERDPWLRQDSNQKVLTAGTGLNSNSVKLDIAVEHRWGSFRKSEDLSPVYLAGRASAFGLPSSPEAEGVSRIREWRLKTSLIYRITNTQKITEGLRRVLGS